MRETTEAFGEATAHWVIKHSKMTERLLKYKEEYFSLREVAEKESGVELPPGRISQFC